MSERGAHDHGGHLDLLQIDGVRAGEGTAAEREHLAGCPRCREELEAVTRLAEGVAALRAARVQVPPGVDRAVLDAFRAAAGPKVVRFPRWRWAAPALGLAAAASLAALLVLPRTQFLSETAPLSEAQRDARGPAAPATAPVAARAEPLRGDVNGDGALDILDAHRLALLVRAGGGAGGPWDENGDGTVDRRDVDALAARVVAL